MPDERPPARPWYDLVMEEMAIRGWGIAELARHAGVSRPTIYGWRDNLSKPRPKPVNDVADKLGIDRRRALRLAGIIGPAPDQPEPEIPASWQKIIDRRPSAERGIAREVAIEFLGDAPSDPPAPDEEEQSERGRRAR